MQTFQYVSSFNCKVTPSSKNNTANASSVAAQLMKTRLLFAVPCYSLFWFLVSGFWFLVSGFWFLVSGFWFLGSGFWFLVSGFWFLVSGFWWELGTMRPLVGNFAGAVVTTFNVRTSTWFESS
jgi:hypothetical protein